MHLRAARSTGSEGQVLYLGPRGSGSGCWLFCGGSGGNLHPRSLCSLTECCSWQRLSGRHLLAGCQRARSAPSHPAPFTSQHGQTESSKALPSLISPSATGWGGYFSWDSVRLTWIVAS